jgi:hypothetical protein
VKYALPGFAIRPEFLPGMPLLFIEHSGHLLIECRDLG